MSNTTVTPEDLQRWDELTQAALVKTNPQLPRPIKQDMDIAAWVATCGYAMPALIAEVRRLTQRAEAAEARVKELDSMLDMLPEYLEYWDACDGPALSLSEWWTYKDFEFAE